MVETRPIPFAGGVALAIKRFDRSEGRRWHALSANVALKAAGVELSYPNLAQLLRRRGDVDTHRAQMHELFRRLVFNILIDNTDDHEKNHVLLVSQAQQYALAPAFDVLPMGQSLGYQAMTVGTQGAESSIENALSAAGQYWLTPQVAKAEVDRVVDVVNAWREHFLAAGVPAASVEELAQHIDRPFLLRQRLGQ